jgi:MFS family permease
LLSSPYFGAIADKKGTFAALSVSCVLVGVGALLFSFVRPSEHSNLWLLFAAQVMLGVGSGTLGVTRYDSGIYCAVHVLFVELVIRA